MAALVKRMVVSSTDTLRETDQRMFAARYPLIRSAQQFAEGFYPHACGLASA